MGSRRIRYRVAMSLDGYIAGPNGEIDWIVADPSIDFSAIYADFDAALLGRRTYELTQQPEAPPWPADWHIYVVSRTLQPADTLGVRVIGNDVESTLAGLRAMPGRDIWLFGGGALAASLLSMDLVDTIELAVMPVVLGAGVQFIDKGARRAGLTLRHVQQSSNGIVNLQYDVLRAAG
jgi:dihydrofolate reductase